MSDEAPEFIPGPIPVPVEFVPAVPVEPPAPKPYGFWASLGIAIAVLIGAGMLSGVLALPFKMIGSMTSEDGPRFGPESIADLASLSAPDYIMSFLVASTLSVYLLAILVKARGMNPKEYFALPRLKFKPTALCLLGLVGFLGTEILAGYLFQNEASPFAKDLVSHPWPLLVFIFIGCVVFVPVMEEVMFRGFLYRGVAESPAGPTFAMFFTSLAWAVLHIQYNVFEMGTIFVLGLFLASIRRWLHSTSICIVVHGAMNAVAVVFAVLLYN